MVTARRGRPAEPAEPSSTIDQLERDAWAAIDELAERPDPEAFAALLRLSEAAGVALGVSARTLAEARSWAQVGSVAGTTRQAAWARWNS